MYANEKHGKNNNSFLDLRLVYARKLVMLPVYKHTWRSVSTLLLIVCQNDWVHKQHCFILPILQVAAVAFT
jgi:hypothetical protein